MTTKTVSKSNAPVIESRDQLIASFARGEKPAERWRIGTEHEKFVYALGDHHAPSYAESSGIRALLGELEQVAGLLQLAPQPEDAERQDAADGERHAPAPGLQVGALHGGLHQQQDAQQQRPGGAQDGDHDSPGSSSDASP